MVQFSQKETHVDFATNTPFSRSCLWVYPRTAVASARLESRSGDEPLVRLQVGIDTETVLDGVLSRPAISHFLRNARHLRHPGGCARLHVSAFGLIVMLASPRTIEILIYRPGAACGGVELSLTAAEADDFLGRLAEFVVKKFHKPLCLRGSSSREYTLGGSMRSRSGSRPPGAASRDFVQ